MTHLLAGTPATVTVYAAAHALAQARAVLIERPGPDPHSLEARAAEDRRTK